VTLMYEEYFGLTKKPFSIVPDPRYFYTSVGHREALAHLLYGIKSDGGFVLLTGEVGTGKTTVCRRLLELMPEDTEVAFILNPKLTVEELLATICDEFRISYPEGNTSIKVFIAGINDYLLDVHAKGRRAVIIIEEAQNLKPEVLEQIRLLTNLETNEHKLLQMIMLGQPELREILKQPQLLQLSQRITARYHLGHLSREEVPAYVNYRLSVAGLVRGQLFPPQTLRRLYRLSGGIPRLINVICDRALLGTYVQGKDQVDMETLMTSAHEVFGEGGHKRQRQRIVYGVLAGFFLVILTALGTVYYMQRTKAVVVASSRPAVQEAVAKAKDNPVKKTNLERPVNYTANATMEMAYQALFKQWQLQYSRGDSRTVCEQARKQGLQCLKGKGNIGHLRLMNRPIVLTLVDEKGDEYFAALISLRGETAVFVIGNETRDIDINEISRRWAGDYFILWRAPQEYKEELKPGDRGPMVAWLDRQLALIQGRPVPTGREQVYHGEIVKEVKRLQLTAGLLADGIVGPRTIICLTAADDNDGPVLHEGKRGG